jgi:hypothetical protein
LDIMSANQQKQQNPSIPATAGILALVFIVLLGLFWDEIPDGIPHPRIDAAPNSREVKVTFSATWDSMMRSQHGTTATFLVNGKSSEFNSKGCIFNMADGQHLHLCKESKMVSRGSTVSVFVNTMPARGARNSSSPGCTIVSSEAVIAASVPDPSKIAALCSGTA